MASYRDRLKSTISNTPGSGSLTISTASAGFLSFVSTDNDQLFDVLIEDGSGWEIAKDCLYTHSTLTLTRGTFVASSTGTALSLASSATVSNVLLAQRMTNTNIDTVAYTYSGGL
jgi:hypothetical protein